MTCTVEVVQLWREDGGARPYVKEPKLVASLAAWSPGLSVLGGGGAVLERVDLGALPHPSRGTAQIDVAGRAGIRFDAPCALDVELDDTGFARWAERAAERPALGAAGARYCLGPGGELKRRWEVAKRPEEVHASCMFHAWQGGSGYADCENAMRAFGPEGESFQVILRYV